MKTLATWWVMMQVFFIRTWLPQIHQMLFCCNQLILQIDTMETAKSRCFCQIKSFKKVRWSFYLLTREPNGFWSFVCKWELSQPPQSLQMLSPSSWLPSDGSETFSQSMLCCSCRECIWSVFSHSTIFHTSKPVITRSQPPLHLGWWNLVRPSFKMDITHPEGV